MSAHPNCIDLNCDLGESFGAWKMGSDAELIAQVSSINIACGFHAGDPITMLETLKLAKLHGVAVGAHPSLPDLRGFGRRALAITPQELYADTLYQIGALFGMAHSLQMRLSHAKAHGALYHMLEASTPDAAKLRDAFVTACASFELGLIGFAGGKLIEAAQHTGVPTANEFFADRRYTAAGLLQPRNEAGAVLETAEAALAQVESALLHGRVQSTSGEPIAVRAQSICLHGDSPGAAQFAQTLRSWLSPKFRVQSAFVAR